MEHVYLVRVLNIAPKDIINEDEQLKAYKHFGDGAIEISNDINDYIYDKYCDEEKDSTSVELMKVSPLSYEELAELYGLD